MTIKYQEKGFALHSAIHAAGHWLRQEDGEWVSSDDVAVQAIIDGFTIANARNAKKADISAHAKALRDHVISDFSVGEMASWTLKLSEARAFQADPNASCPLLAIEAYQRGVPLAQLVRRVLDNSTTFASIEAAIAGREGFHRDIVDALATFDEVNAYDFSTGWPQL